MADAREQGRVALFIDWDNLQISTQNDYQDRPAPDLASIVQKAQEYGQVIVARAYAEWQRHEDRMEIYRQGLEPVYAPVFRFEPDPSAPQIKGKSLADPIMVSDCVDYLHLLPNITCYVLVTGDKDMIPVVRLAKLRGRRTVLIAPEYVARELEKMVDEIVWYRDLIGVTAQPRVPGHQRAAQQARLAAESMRHAGGRGPAPRPHTRQPGGNGRTIVAAAPAPAPAVAPTPEPVRLEATPIDAATLAAAVQPTPPEGAESLDAVFAAIVDILQKMSAQGKTKVRATNLKDKLLERNSNFSEKHYGFSKFKDLLFAAQRNSVLTVTSTGPVQWVQLPPGKEAAPDTEVAAAPVASAGAPVAPAPSVAPSVTSQASAPRPMPVSVAAPAVPAPAPAPAPGTAEATTDEEMEFDDSQREQIIRFIDELRTRSRWLTYTYVLTNVMTYLRNIFQERGLPEQHVDSEARGILNHLVNIGVLRVDKEPREVEVSGAKHRIRMCHLVDDNRHVVAALRDRAVVEAPTTHPAEGETGEQTESDERTEAAEATADAAEEPPTFTQSGAPTETEPAGAPEPAESPAEESPSAPVALLPVATDDAPGGTVSVSESVQTVESEPAEAGESADESTDEAGDAGGDGTARSRSRRSRGGRRGRGGRGGEDGAEVAAGEPVVAEARADEAPPAAAPAAATATNGGASPAALQTAFDALVDVVRQATRAGGGPVKASGLKLRLGRRFGSFDERRLGFARFSDFLEAAEREGRISVSTDGQGAFVTLPAGVE